MGVSFLFYFSVKICTQWNEGEGMNFYIFFKETKQNRCTHLFKMLCKFAKNVRKCTIRMGLGIFRSLLKADLKAATEIREKEASGSPVCNTPNN